MNMCKMVEKTPPTKNHKYSARYASHLLAVMKQLCLIYRRAAPKVSFYFGRKSLFFRLGRKMSGTNETVQFSEEVACYSLPKCCTNDYMR